jgi:DNA polymerase-3 subunit delta'
MHLQSQVIITAQFEETITQLRALATENERFEVIRPEEGKAFGVKDAKRAIEKAHITSYERKIVILMSDAFSDVVQNKLLKVFEEPPHNTEFILLLPTKSTLLSTIRSRLPVTVLDETDDREALNLDLRRLDVRSVYAFVQENKRTDSAKAKVLLEQIANAAIQTGSYRLDERTLDYLRDSRLALDKGSPPSFVLIGALLKLLAKKKKAGT